MDNIENYSGVFILAEAGVNHNGSLELAYRLVDEAKSAGANAVKFQTWKHGEVAGRFSHNLDYMENTGGPESHYELLERLALSYDSFRSLKAYCDQKGILFLSTPDGFESLDFLVDELEMPIIKIGSTEVTHLPYLLKVGSKKRPVLLSTGCSNLGEVEAAVAALGQGGAPKITLLHCTSAYPAPYEEINLKAMQTLAAAFRLPVGFSDHSLGVEAAVAAVALGAVVIEKHFTFDKAAKGPDHKASMSTDELANLVKSIRNTESLLGKGCKQPSPTEAKNIPGIRRSIVAARPLVKGSRLERGMLACKRPGTGIPPSMLETVTGMRINRDLDEDEPLTWDDLK